MASDKGMGAFCFEHYQYRQYCTGTHYPVDKIMSEDKVNHPSHYNQGGIECIEGIKGSMSLEAFKGYLKGNVLKYIWRYEHKNKLEDLHKSTWYLDRLIKENE